MNIIRVQLYNVYVHEVLRLMVKGNCQGGTVIEKSFLNVKLSCAYLYNHWWGDLHEDC